MEEYMRREDVRENYEIGRVLGEYNSCDAGAISLRY